MCDCQVGLGKFEGEPALTFLAYEASMDGSDEITGDGELGTVTSWIRGPFIDFDAYRDSASAYGYCDACIDGALTDKSYGISLWESEQGFVQGTTYASKEEFDKALGDAEAEDLANAECEDEND